MIIRSRHIYRLIPLVLAGVLFLSISWEFYLEDLIVPRLYAHFQPEPFYEHIEYILLSAVFAAFALIIPGWIAIHSARQSEYAMKELGKAHAELELRVQKRTAELETANRKLVSALERQRKTEEALRGSVQDLKQLSSCLLVLQEDKKKLIASELHDSISQTLSALKFRFEHILSHGQDGKMELSADLQDKLLPSIQGAIDDVRNIYMDLRPTLLDDFGLIATLNWQDVEFRKKLPHIQFASHIGVDENGIPEHLKIVIFRVLKEGLSNIAAHSQAKVVSYSLNRNDSTLDLVLQDDGIGFDMVEIQSGAGTREGTGLSSMRARVELTAGHFQIETEKGAGVMIRASWPLHDDETA